ncbi:MAG: hypothetical protein NC548_42900 [Lachnospiraceae bacterium]|nr:hypothetical protein [Lachnospiraceae bacterium]
MNRLELYNKFRSLPNVVEKDDYWFATRCVLCGDSTKNPTKKRLYIHLDPTNATEPIGYKCFNCMAHGVVTSDMLRKIGMSDNAYTVALKEINAQAVRLSGTQKTNKYRKMKTLPLELPEPYKDEIILKKIHYLYKERLGYMIPLDELKKLKIVWKLTDLLKLNHLEINRTWHNFIQDLDNDYIGFLSVRNEYIIFRDITNKHEMRYIKYGIMKGMENASSYYAIDNTVPILSREPIDIIVAEGTFDIIGILYHLYNGDTTNRKFVSTSEGDFENPIMYHINQGLIGENINVLCYVDNDTVADYERLKKRLKPYIGSISFFHNTKFKDFGVSKDNIEVEPFNIRLAEQNRRNRFKK